MEISFCELKQKEVVNVCDGRRLGKVIDLVISLTSCKVLGIVVPGNKKIFNTREDIFIPWQNIKKIGGDVVLVQLTLSQQVDTDKCAPSKPKRQKCALKPYVVEQFDDYSEEFTLDDE